MLFCHTVMLDPFCSCTQYHTLKTKYWRTTTRNNTKPKHLDKSTTGPHEHKLILMIYGHGHEID